MPWTTPGTNLEFHKIALNPPVSIKKGGLPLIYEIDTITITITIAQLEWPSIEMAIYASLFVAQQTTIISFILGTGNGNISARPTRDCHTSIFLLNK